MSEQHCDQSTDQPAMAAQMVNDLAMIVRRLCYRLRRLDPNYKGRQEAMEFLEKNGLSGSILRDAQGPACQTEWIEPDASQIYYFAVDAVGNPIRITIKVQGAK
jgi:hypothetical protein